MRVCLIIEGSYPYITGGVSSWIHELIGGLPDIDFSLFTFSPVEGQRLRYTLPTNVVEHVDIILTRPQKTHTRPRDTAAMTAAIMKTHSRMGSNLAFDPQELFTRIPEGYSLSADSVRREETWSLIVESNQKRNPLYPFSDYFWAWKSSHDLIFTTLAAKAPEADIYHSVSTGFAGLAALAAKLRHKKPFILTEHGLYHKEREIEIRKARFVKGYQRDLWIGIYNTISELCYRNADCITSLFEENRQKQIILGADSSKCLAIPNGIDFQRFAVKREKRPGFHIGLVGRVVPIKDVKTFITAAKIVAERAEEAKFYVIGPDDEDLAYHSECLRLTESLKLENILSFTGRKDVREYYSFLDVVVLTSIREAQPLVILEAFAAGIPIVSTDVGNIGEMLRFDGRFLAPVKDAKAIADGIMFVHEHPDEIGKIVEENRKIVLEEYEKKDLFRRFGELYGRLAGGGDRLRA